MSFAGNFIAIDFETANRRSDSACQLAAVVVREGAIAEQKMWLIRPEPFDFSPMNIQIHGIWPDQVEHEPCFGELWPEIADFLKLDRSSTVRRQSHPEPKSSAIDDSETCLVAHNASFDIGVLLACLASHRCPAPELRYTCTRAVARQTWPQRPRFGLKPLADWLGIRFRHHDALEDSIACAKIMIAAAIDRQVNTLEELEQSLRLSRGSAGSWGKRGPAKVRSSTRRQSSAGSSPGKITTASTASATRDSDGVATFQESQSAVIDSLDLQRLMIRAEFIQSLSGKNIVFSGSLTVLNRDAAELLAVKLGGCCQATVTRETNVLVLGQSEQNLSPAKRPTKVAETMVTETTARQYQSDGCNLRILSEREFLGLVVNDLD